MYKRYALLRGSPEFQLILFPEASTSKVANEVGHFLHHHDANVDAFFEKFMSEMIDRTMLFGGILLCCVSVSVIVCLVFACVGYDFKKIKKNQYCF